MRFIVHASIWDTIVLLLIGGFAVIYTVLWGLTAWKERKKARK